MLYQLSYFPIAENMCSISYSADHAQGGILTCAMPDVRKAPVERVALAASRNGRAPFTGTTQRKSGRFILDETQSPRP